MKRIVRPFRLGRSQVVRLPGEFEFTVSEIFVQRDGEKIILSPRPFSWDAYLAEGPIAPDDFMAGVESLRPQERAP
jgi:antitoxin VapB